MEFLKNHSWQISYSSAHHNLIADFYIPALEHSIQYDRKSGFFSSAILSRVAAGLGAFLSNNGQMRLILGCELSPEDVVAIQQGYELREATLAQHLAAHLTEPRTLAEMKRLEILSWLIQVGRLDIRIAIPFNPDTDRQGQPNYLFHEKVCIFTDAQGQQLATNGSNNESGRGWENNVESFHVFCSWEGQRDLTRVQDEVSRFEQLWHDTLPTIRSCAVPEAIRQKLLRYAPRQQPTWHPDHEFNHQPLEGGSFSSPALEPVKFSEIPLVSAADHTAEYQFLQQLQTIGQHPGCLDFCLKTIPVQPWPHQLKILRRIADTFPRSYLIADEVGLGKTIETGLILRYLLISGKAQRILVLAPASVQPQWQTELREKFNLSFWSYSGSNFRDPYGNITAPHPDQNPWDSQNLILASSHLVRRRERMVELLAAQPWDYVVLDEAHHARRKAPQQRQDTPNRLLQLLRQLKDRTQALLLLSATPMQIDTIEIFDLLTLLGLKGEWAYGDPFCHYFGSLSEEPDRHLLQFWQSMSVDYLKQGGQPSSRLQTLLAKQNRLLASRVEDVWTGQIPLLNSQQSLKDPDFLAASRQYLTLNTPLKDLMFRHTRDTLRQYYRLGLLASDVPRRIVCDNTIVLDTGREEELYRAVSDYVRHFYRLAQKENRKALGFLMTLYRKRLTSSFYAIQQSLQRRLEALLEHQGTGLVDDDFNDLEDAEDAVIEGLEDLIEPVDPREVEYLSELLRQFDNTGEDSKLSQFLILLRQEVTQRDSAIVFTQYTDTMDYLRDTLRQIFCDQVACYSGRGGEYWHSDQWKSIPKEVIKRRFQDGHIKLLLCTESASEGLNLQTCGVLFNYDLPWNPMRVEQRIGRIDRIGQTYSEVRIHNFYYDGTVEARVYQALRNRINAFETVVGNLQPILAQVPTFIERATMSADPEEENVLMAEFEDVLNTPPIRPTLDEMVQLDVEADLEEIRRPLTPSPIKSSDIEQFLATSQLLKQAEINCKTQSPDCLCIEMRGQIFNCTTSPAIFEEQPSLRLLTPGEPVLNAIIEQLVSPNN
jgi:ERCC4-related helicase